MPGGEERILRKRIRSVTSTKKITRAMELIAATRVVQAQNRTQAARPYADQITAVVRSLAAAGANSAQPLLSTRDNVRKVAYVVVASDRGLCGSYNSAVLRTAERALIADRQAGRDVTIYAVGKKAEDFFRFRKYPIAQSFKGFSDKPAYADAKTVAEAVMAAFDKGSESGGVDQIQLFHTTFLSMASQRVSHRQFAPLAIETGAAAGPSVDYEFEPDPTTILASLLPRYVESRMYAALLESAASEHASRQRAMKSATDNAGEMVKGLARRMNQARQAAITTEIMEIVGGAEAIADAKASGGDLIADRSTVKKFFDEMQSTPTVASVTGAAAPHRHAND